MAQSPDNPKDDGKVRLPKPTPGSNKIAPTAISSGRGAKSDKKSIMLGAPEGKDAQKLQDVLARVRKRFDRCVAAEGDNRSAALDDLKFKAGDQWPQDVAAQRNFDKRPCLTINKLPTFVNQITNDLRQNRPTINVSPVGDRGDPEVAKMYRGLIRAIERDSHADIAYDTAVDGAVSNGFGYCRLDTEHESPTDFNQVIAIRRIRNPFTVYLDPDHQEPDGSDSRFGFVTEMVPRSEFEDEYPDATPVPFVQSGIGESFRNWISQDTIRIAEYFEVGHSMRTLVQLSNGFTGWEDELSEEVKQAIADDVIEVVNERQSSERKVHWYKCTSLEIVEDRETVWGWVPLIKFIGTEIDIEGKVQLAGVIRNAKDPQRMYNYWSTAETELIALAPKAPWVIEEGQLEGHEAEWKQANIRSYPYLAYKASSVAGKPAPPPQRQQFAQVPAGVVNAKQGAAQDMMATTGVRFDATMNERMIDESGKAIKELRRSGDLGSFHYADNMARSLRHIGRMLIDAIPKVYDTKRVLTILREDDTEERVQIDPDAPKAYQEIRPQQQIQPGQLGQPGGNVVSMPGMQQPPQQPKTLKIFNPTYGKYGVTVDIGPSYATKRIEASESMMNFVRALPNTAALVADLIAAEQDWPGAEKIAARLAKAVPPQLLTPDQKDVPPQVQAMLQAMDAQIKQLSAERVQLMKQLTDTNADRQVELTRIQNDFESRLLKIVADVETKTAATHEKATANVLTHVRAVDELGTKVVELMHKIGQADKPESE